MVRSKREEDRLMLLVEILVLVMVTVMVVMVTYMAAMVVVAVSRANMPSSSPVLSTFIMLE